MRAFKENKRTMLLTKLYAFTCTENGIEKIVVGSDNVPFLYISMEAVVACNALDTIQKLSNTTKQRYTFKNFELKSIIDTIIPEISNMEV